MREVLNRGMQERKVKVKTQRLLKTLKENRLEHQEKYEEAMKGYKVLAKEKLEKLKKKTLDGIESNFAAILDKIDKFDPEEGQMSDTVTLISSMQFSLEVPENHTKAYDVAIDMADWEQREEVEILQSEFECFVRDDWDWSKDFQHLNVRYSEALR